MGCTGSRHALRGGVRKSFGRSRSGPAAAGPAHHTAAGPAHHTVALKSSTLGSLSLDRDEDMMKWRADSFGGAAKGKATTPAPPPQPQLARRQRQVIGTPTKTPVREPEVINVWELMEGLDDSKNDERDAAEGAEDGRREQSPPGSPEFDPEVISAFRKALGEASPPRDYQGDGECVKKREIQRFPGIVRARVSAFQQRIDAKLAKMARSTTPTPTPAPTSPPPSPPPQPRLPPPPDSHKKVVLYLTSLRGIRKTFEDCWATKSILQGYGVRIDERDLSLHGGFKDELHASLGCAGRLPQVFVDGEHLGGAEDVRRLHEAGELSGALEACEMALPTVGGKGAALEACSGCGGVRFVPCEECSGSCKVFLEELDSFRRCPDCNENGLVRCPLCCL